MGLTKYLIILLALYSIVLLPATNVRGVSDTRYYAGYYGPYSKSGVKGNILTKDSEVSIANILAEWVNIYLNYNPTYWIQLGYTQHWVWIIIPFVTLDFYVERVDDLGTWQVFHIIKPLVGHTYNYEIYYEMGYMYNWRCTIREGSLFIYRWDLLINNKYSSKRLAAFVETSDTSIDIDSGHFTNLKYYDYPNWYLWNTHSTYDTGPYFVNSISHYEFYANGGG